MAIGFNSIGASDSWCRRRKRNYAMSIERLFDAVERRGDIGWRVAALGLPISNRPRVTSRCAGKIGLREPGEHTSGPNLASGDNVAHNQTVYTILETPPPVIPLYRKQARTYAIRARRPSQRGTDAGYRIGKDQSAGHANLRANSVALWLRFNLLITMRRAWWLTVKTQRANL